MCFILFRIPKLGVENHIQLNIIRHLKNCTYDFRQK